MSCRLSSRHGRLTFGSSRISFRHNNLRSNLHNRLYSGNRRTYSALLDDLIKRRRHPVDKRFRIKPHEEYHENQGDHYGYLTPAKVLKLLVLGVIKLSEHYALEHPEHIDGGKNDAT